MRKCPECRKNLPAINGVKFDKDHNVICTQCNATVIAAVVSHERKIVVTTNSYNYPYKPNPLGGYNHQYDGYGD